MCSVWETAVSVGVDEDEENSVRRRKKERLKSGTAATSRNLVDPTRARCCCSSMHLSAARWSAEHIAPRGESLWTWSLLLAVKTTGLHLHCNLQAPSTDCKTALELPLIHPLTHQGVAAVMHDAASTIGSHSGFSRRRRRSNFDLHGT